MKKKLIVKKKSTNELLQEISEKLDILIATQSAQVEDPAALAETYVKMGITYERASKLTGVPEGTLKSRSRTKRKKKGVKK